MQQRLSVGGVQLDQAVAGAFLAALTPAGLQAAVAAAERLEADHDAALAQWRLEVERTRYQATKAERRYLAVDPDNRLVARGLERDWEAKLAALAAAEAELASRERRRPRTLTAAERAAIGARGGDLARVWSAPTTTDRDRKELLGTLLEEVIVNLDRDAAQAHLTMRWRGGAISQLDVALPRCHPPKIRTSEDTIALVRRLAAHYPDAQIAGILNRQGRRSARGQRFTASIVQGLRPTGASLAPSRLPSLHRASWSPSPRPRSCLAWSPRPCTAGWPTASSPASSPPQAHPGASGSPTSCAPASSNRPPRAGWRCWRPPRRWASPARRCCSVSSAASYAPSTSAPDGEKACVSRSPRPTGGCWTPSPAPRGQCDAGSKQSRTSASTTWTHPKFSHRQMASEASLALRLGRNPKELGRNWASKIGSMTSRQACCTTRSFTVGIDSGLVLPGLPGFGIFSRRTGLTR